MSYEKLEELKVDDIYLQKFGMSLESEFLSPLIEIAWEHLLTRIFDLNDDIRSHKTLLKHFLNDDNEDSESKIEGFKFAQYKVIEGLLNSDDNPITQEVDAILSGRCRLIKRNGWQLK